MISVINEQDKRIEDTISLKLKDAKGPLRTDGETQRVKNKIR